MATAIYSPSGASAGVGFAIPVSLAVILCVYIINVSESAHSLFLRCDYFLHYVG